MTNNKTKLLDFAQLIGTNREIRLVIIDSDYSFIDEKKFKNHREFVSHINSEHLQKYYKQLYVTSALILDDYTYIGSIFPE